MQFPDETKTHREIPAQALDPMVEGADVVRYLQDIGLERPVLVSSLVLEEVCDLGLGSLDLRAQHGLQAHVRTDEEGWIGDEPANAAESVEGTRRFVKQQRRPVRVL